MAKDKHISPAEQLLSLWGDQNHTVTELFMVLNRYFTIVYWISHAPANNQKLIFKLTFSQTIF